MPDEVDQLRQQFPAWQFGSIWTTVATGPDYRRLSARLGTILLTAADANEMREKLAHEREIAPPAS